MAHVALENGEGLKIADLSAEDFTVVADEENGHFTLIIPRIAVSLSSEKWCDWVVHDILDGIDFYEKQK